ncbi:hypothetical protein FRB97_004772 [Tulasnella sp. 331]|nr:hypothetical protein FRB97_004772 [Tulasnella sp. 331]KAG8881196.1 hypothetical protein FRB98_004508 [Tulasnella sp. 332]
MPIAMTISRGRTVSLNAYFPIGLMYELWKGTWLDKYAVVMKTYRGREFDGQPTEADRTRIDRQVCLWRSLEHKNVLQCCGIVLLNEGETDGTSICSISPWLHNRDVMRYIQVHPEANRMQLVYDVAKGLQYLHGAGIRHDALQGSNVLVDDRGNAVLSDFSITKTLDPNTVMTRTSLGPSLGWSAPETVGSQILSVQADVYSWAMTALEIFSGLKPYHGIVSTRKLMDTIMQHITPQREDYMSSSASLQDDRLWNLLLSCWDPDPEKRPTMGRVVERLEAMHFGLVVLSDTTHHIPNPVATGGELRRHRSPSSLAATDCSKETIPCAPGIRSKRCVFAKIIKSVGTWIC